MADTCRRMNATGLNQGTSGKGLLITPTSPPSDAMEPSDLVPMGFDGHHAGGRRPPVAWRFHRDILVRRGDVAAVLHTHSVYATTLVRTARSRPSAT